MQIFDDDIEQERTDTSLRGEYLLRTEFCSLYNINMLRWLKY